MRRILLLALTAAGMLAAQDPPARVGRLAYISGAVSFNPAGSSDWVPAQLNRPLTIDDQLFTDNGALAEVQIPGAVFRLGSHTAFQFLNLDDRLAQVRLSEGMLNVHVRNIDQGIEIDTPNQAFTVKRPGDYRVDTNPNTLESYITVREGEGQVTGPGGAFTIYGGQQAVVAGQNQNARYRVYQAPAYDSFDQWAMSRERLYERYAHARYVSDEMVGYEDLDEYGSWRPMPQYGEMWFPAVAAGWAPYRAGHWVWVDPWGWTWVDDEPWGFAPFHYGRWAYVDGLWGWCPGPVRVAPVYAPALVAWVGFGGGFGISIGVGGGPAVGWFPLGPRDVYIPAYAASPAYVTRVNVTNTTIINHVMVTNVYDAYRRSGSIPVARYMNRTAPGALVAIPRSALTSARPVQQVALRIRPNEVRAMRAAAPTPRVAPRMASVLGRPVSAAAHTPRPPAVVIRRPVVARAAPPPPVPAVQRRLTALARTPGRPLPIAQQQRMARSAPAAAVVRPPVRVVAHARTVRPPVVKAPPPHAPRAAAHNVPQPPQRSASRSYQPPAARRQTAPRQPQRGNHAAQARPPQPPQRSASRSYQPPAARRQTAPRQPQRGNHAAQARPPQPPQPPQRSASRSFERPAQRAYRPPVRQQPRVQAQTRPPVREQPRPRAPQYRPAPAARQRTYQAAARRPQPPSRVERPAPRGPASRPAPPEHKREEHH
jgi:Family of unknown function (DUF6600)